VRGGRQRECGGREERWCQDVGKGGRRGWERGVERSKSTQTFQFLFSLFLLFHGHLVQCALALFLKQFLSDLLLPNSISLKSHHDFKVRTYISGTTNPRLKYTCALLLIPLIISKNDGRRQPGAEGSTAQSASRTTSPSASLV
jgi:hypothetical protein